MSLTHSSAPLNVWTFSSETDPFAEPGADAFGSLRPKEFIKPPAGAGSGAGEFHDFSAVFQPVWKPAPGFIGRLHAVVNGSQTLDSGAEPTEVQSVSAEFGPADAPSDGLTPAQVSALANGLSQTLDSLDAQLVSQVFAETLPIVGNNFADAAGAGAAQFHYLSALKTALTGSQGLASLTGPGPFTKMQVDSALGTALSSAGLGGFASLDLSDAADVKLNFSTGKNDYSPLSLPVESDLGLPNLGFTASGTAQSTLRYQFDFTAGLDGAGFYVDAAPGKSFFPIATDTKLASLDPASTLSGTSFNATDNAASPTDFAGTFYVTLNNPGGDGRLRTTGLGGDLVDATLAGFSGINLNLTRALPGSALPTIDTFLRVSHSFGAATVDPADNNATFGSVPAVSFASSVDLGTFFHQFAGPVLQTVSDVTAPFHAVLDVLTTQFGLLAKLNDATGLNVPTSLLDLLGATPQQRAVIQGLSDIAGLTQLANDFAGGAAAIQLGTLNVNGDLRVTPLADVSTVIGSAPQPPGSQNGYLGNFLNAAMALGGGNEVSFPLLTNPEVIGKLLLGQGEAEFFEYNPPALDLALPHFRQFFPVLGPFGVTLGGSLGFKADFDFGFDTLGIRTGDVFDGFFVRAFDDGGDPATFVELNGGFSAGVAVNVVVAEVGVEGDLQANVFFPFRSSVVDSQGKVRGTLIADSIASGHVFDLFAPGGEISAGLKAYVEIGIDPISTTITFDSPRQTLYSFGQSSTEPPVLISELPDGSLRLNAGPRSAFRERGNLNDTAEHFEVSYLDLGGPFGSAVVVKAFDKISVEFKVGPGQILVGDGGDFSDTLETTPDFPLQVIFVGGNGSDTLVSGAGDDILAGGAGRDRLLGGAGEDTLQGGEGDDVLIGGPGADTLDGGPGFDLASYEFSPGGLTIDLRTSTLDGEGAGDTFSGIEGVIGTQFGDLIHGTDGDDGLLSGLDGDDTLFGNDGNDVIDGGAGVDTIYAGAGNDLVYAQRDGGDLIFGGEGIDTISFTNSAVIITVNLLTSPNASGNTVLQFENIFGSFPHSAGALFFDDQLDGDDGPNVIYGFNGFDLIRGHGGDDVIYGNFPSTGGLFSFGDLPDPELGTVATSDADEIHGGDGNDRIYGQADNDNLYGDSGNDFVDGGQGDDYLEGGGGSDQIYGGIGNDTLYGNAPGAIDDPTAHDLLDGGDGNDTLFVRDGTNMLFGGIGDDHLQGGSGDDVLEGGPDFIGDGSDDDYLEGGGGNDTFRGGAGQDTIYGSMGNDIIDGGPGDDYIDAQDGNNFIRGGTGNDTIIALFNDDTIYGDEGDDMIDAGPGRNVVFGGPGNDTIMASFSDDTIDGGDGNDTIDAMGGNNVLSGGNGNDSLKTLGGNDMLDGGDGNDFLDAGNGTDSLDGGAGDDMLVVGSLRASAQDEQRTDHLFGGPGFDTITADFSNQTDAIVIIAGQTQSLVFADGAEARDFENVGDLFTGSGDDFIRLDGPADNQFQNFLKTGAGNDTIYSGAANDYVDAGDGDDFVDGGSNETVLSFPGGNPTGTPGDTLIGGPGNDTISFAGIVQFQNGHPLGVLVNLATNVTGLGASGTVISGFENVIGTPFRDDLTGDDGPNVFRPGRGGGYGTSGGLFDPEQIDGAGGEDTLVIDFSVFDPANGLGVATVGRGFLRLTVGNVSVLDNYSYANIEHLDITGASKDDTIYPETYGFSDILRGLGGNDVLGGYGGSDTLLGGEGNDLLTAQGQFDAGYFGVAGGHDVFDGGPGDDLVEDIALIGTVHSLDAATALFELDGGTGFDRLSVDFGNQSAPIIWDSATPTDITFADGAYARNFEQLRWFVAGSGNDTIIQRGRVDNQLFLGDGDDFVNPGLGVDYVEGGAGFDTVVLDFSVGDTPELAGVQGGGFGSSDRATFFRPLVSDFFTRPDNVEIRGFERVEVNGTSKNDDISGTGFEDILRGGGGDDVLSGQDGNDDLDGGSGADTLRGGQGNDRYWVDSIADVIVEKAGEGTDTVFALIDYNLGPDVENMVLAGRVIHGAGNALANIITGNARGNVLDGGDGDDVITGGFGLGLAGSHEVDVLHGGAGADTFVLGDANFRYYDDHSSLTPGTSGYARIDDFTPSAGDHLQLHGAATEYFLDDSPLPDVPGTALFHDTNFDAIFEPSYDELIAIIDSPDALTHANLIDAAIFM